MAPTLISFRSVVLVILGACVVKASDSDFQNCFCFQSDGKWCAEGATEGFYRNSCAQWLTDAMLWTIPAFILLLGLIFFPCFFCAARVCCNCCGGREPTDGCCCPSKPSVRVYDDGTEVPIPHEYSNRAIFCTKFFYAVCFGFWVYYSVGVYVLNHRVDNALIDVSNAVVHEATNLYDVVDAAANASMQLSNSTYTSTAPLAETLHHALTQYTNVLSDIKKIVTHIQDAETQQQYGRNQDAYRVPSVPMIVLFPALILMVCNVRGAVMTIASGLFAWSAVPVVCAFIFHELVAQASTALCNNYNQTFVPAIINATTWGGGCGSPTTTATVSVIADEYFTTACTAGLAVLCTSSMVSCPTDAYNNLCLNASAIGDASVDGWGSLIALLNQTITTTKITTSNCNVAGGCSLSWCATEFSSDPDMQSNCSSLLAFSTATLDSMQVLLGEFYPSYTDCNGIHAALIAPDIQGTLCGVFSTNFTNISIQFLSLSILSIAGTILLILGAKRFAKMKTIDQNAPIHPVTGAQCSNNGAPNNQRFNPSAFAYRVLLQTDEERAVMGSPLLGDHSQDPSYGQGYYLNTNSTANGQTAAYGGVQPVDAPLNDDSNASLVSMATHPQMTERV